MKNQHEERKHWPDGMECRSGNRNGFTLIELLVALAIVAILAAVAVPGYNGYVAQGRQAEARRELMAIAQMEELFRFQNGTYTADMAAIGALGWTDNSIRYAFDITAATATTFTARAQGDVDGDATVDVWTINENGDPQNTTDDSDD